MIEYIGNFDIWKTLGIITVVLLIIFWRKRNAVWGGLTIGAIIGLIIATFFAFKEQGFNWHIIRKAVIVGTITGFFAELLGKVAGLFNKAPK